MNPVVSTVELTGKEIKNMLEENLERTFSSDAMKQMGGYVKRSFGIHVNMRIENPKGNRIQEIFVGDQALKMDETYKVAFVTSQGVPEKLGKNRTDLQIKAVEAMVNYLQKNNDIKPMETPVFKLV